MHKTLERLWVSWLDSKYWRRFAGQGFGGKIMHTRTFRRINLARRFALTEYKSRRRPLLFQDVHTFCAFVGHVKSGSTLIGALLDAHPDAVIADEIDVLSYAMAGFRKEQIFHILLKAARRDYLKGRVTARRLAPYSVAVPGQWQGRYRSLQVIGHSQAGPVTRKLSEDLSLLDQLRETMSGIDLKLIHVIRNPFDPISLMMQRGNRSFANAIDHYFSYCEALSVLHRRLGQENLFAVRYEAFVENPRTHLNNICRFLDLEASDEYLEACITILYDSPEQSRQDLDWEDRWIERVEQEIAQVPFLAGYSYEGLSQPAATNDGAAPSVEAAIS
ncbi:MAG TPA: sulfotransferase [Candidatus Binatia bacterium]|nr:sulfotransferase [Candidatus Binatia bacterium]